MNASPLLLHALAVSTVGAAATLVVPVAAGATTARSGSTAWGLHESARDIRGWCYTWSATSEDATCATACLGSGGSYNDYRSHVGVTPT